MKNIQKLTLIIVHDNKKILLGMKKRGFGEGKWNGFGGKVEKNESVSKAAERELFEESGLKIRKNSDLIKNGKVNFCFDNDMEKILEVNIFSINNKYVFGTLQESNEMLPKWFDIEDIPYENMWISDQDWLPLLLKGNIFSGDILFGDDGDKIIKINLKIK